ncbi:MAG: IPT/TIG domain-containing protein [Aequorivita sp.]
MCLLVSSCSKKDDNRTLSQLIITSFSPMEASIGDEIIFLGENIDVSTEYSIFFNGVVATTVQNFPTELRAIVPQGASTGNITIRYGETILDVGSLTILELPELIITSFSPMEAFIGDEVTFIGENIDPEITYIVSFNGLEGETTSVTETEIVSIIPEGATSGEVTISYGNMTISVGTIEIIIELDKLYGFSHVNPCSLSKIYNLDINSGAVLDEIAEIYASGCDSYISTNFYRAGNVFIYIYSERISQGMHNYTVALIKDFNSGVTYSWVLDRGDPVTTKNLLAPHDNKIYYVYRENVDKVYDLKVSNLNGSGAAIVYRFPFERTYDFKYSNFLSSTNELALFATDETGQKLFLKVNVETSTLTTHNISDEYSKIFITKTERIFGVKSLGNDHEIVEIDKITGNVLATIANIQAGDLRSIDYSISSNSIFALLNGHSLYRLNLDNGNSSTIALDLENHRDFKGIYLND